MILFAYHTGWQFIASSPYGHKGELDEVYGVCRFFPKARIPRSKGIYIEFE